MRTMSFLAGAAVGYVLGAKAGQERYKEIVERVRGLGNNPTVQQAQAKVTDLLNSRSDVTSTHPTDAPPRSSSTTGPL